MQSGHLSTGELMKMKMIFMLMMMIMVYARQLCKGMENGGVIKGDSDDGDADGNVDDCGGNI